MDTNTRKVIEYLEPKGLGIYDDIANVLTEIFGKELPPSEEAKHKGRLISGFLDTLIEEGIISMRDRPDHELGKKTGAGTFMWLGFQPIGAALRSKGLELLALERAKGTENPMEKSVLTTNASIERLNGITEKFISFQKAWIIIVGFATGISAITGIVATVNDLNKTDERQLKELQQTNNILQRTSLRIDTLNQILKKIEIPINKPLVASTKK